MDTEMPLHIEGHLFTCTYIQTWTMSEDTTYSIEPPQLVGCGCNILLPLEVNRSFSMPQELHVVSKSEVSRLSISYTDAYSSQPLKRVHIEARDSRAFAPRPTLAPSPAKDTRGSVGPTRNSNRKHGHSVKSPTFAPCIISPEEAAIPAGKRRCAKSKPYSRRIKVSA
jgi:hypothetical protein